MPNLDGLYSHPKLTTGSSVGMNALEVILFRPEIDKNIEIKKYRQTEKKPRPPYMNARTSLVPLTS